MMATLLLNCAGMVANSVDLPDAPLLPNTRVQFDFDDDGRQLRFVDQRMFGGLQLSADEAELPPPDRPHCLGPFRSGLRPRGSGPAATRQAVHRQALPARSETVGRGIGNIYADETLWRCRLHYEQPNASLSQRRAVELLSTARVVMTESLAQGGTSFDALYVDINGSSGYFSRNLAAYGRQDQPCDRCGTPDRAGAVHESLVLSLPRLPAQATPKG